MGDRGNGEGQDFWQSASDMMTALVLVLMLVVLLLALKLTGHEDKETGPEIGTESVTEGYWNENDDRDDDGREETGRREDDDSSGGGGGRRDESERETETETETEIVSPSGSGGHPNDGVKTAVFVEMVDDDTEKRIPEEGVTFQLFSSGRSLQILHDWYPVKKEHMEYLTTEKGEFYLPEKIWQGWYFLREITEPEGYDSAGDVEFDATETADWGEPITVQVRLKASSNVVAIERKDADTGLPVGGGSYEIVADGDVVTKDGTTRFKDGEVACVVEIGEDGVGRSEEIFLGTYIVREKEAPEFYATADEPEAKTKVRKKNGKDPDAETFENHKTEAVYRVVDASDGETPVEGVELTLTGGGKTETATTGADGTAYFTDLKAGTEYSVKETGVPEGRKADGADRGFKVDGDGRIDGEAVHETVVTSAITRVKIGTSGTAPWNGAKGKAVELYDENGDLVDSWTENGAGKTLEGLGKGKYSVKVDGEDEAEFEIASDGEQATVDVKTEGDRTVPIALGLGVATVVGATAVLARRRKRKGGRR